MVFWFYILYLLIKLCMFSKSCEYAIKAMIYLAQKSKDGGRRSIKEIAGETDAPVYFVAKIMQHLCQQKLVQSEKGAGGGYYMEESHLNISIADIVKAVDGDQMFVNCVLGLKVCSEINPCPVHFEYKKIKKSLITMMEDNTIGSFNEKLDSGKFFLKNT